MSPQHTLRVSDVFAQDLDRNAPVLAEWALAFAVLVTKWTIRHRTRKQLKDLPDHLLRDIGLPRDAAYTEARRPFWRV